MCKCELCGIEYDNYMRTFKVNGKIVCNECFTSEGKKINNSGKFYFYPHIPSCCEGCDVNMEVFDNIPDLLNRLKEYEEYGTLAVDNCDEEADVSNYVMTVSKDGKHWWVHGFTNAKLNLPNYESLIKQENE